MGSNRSEPAVKMNLILDMRLSDFSRMHGHPVLFCLFFKTIYKLLLVTSEVCLFIQHTLFSIHDVNLCKKQLKSQTGFSNERLVLVGRSGARVGGVLAAVQGGVSQAAIVGAHVDLGSHAAPLTEFGPGFHLGPHLHVPLHSYEWTINMPVSLQAF